MIRVEDIKQALDCRDVIGAELGKPKSHNSKYNIYKCPLHGETKGYSFAVYPDGWKCFGACNTSGDVLTWLDRRHGMNWREACHHLVASFNLDRTLLGENAPRRSNRQRRPVIMQPQPRPAPPAEPPPMEWQRRVYSLVELAESYLWNPAYPKGLEYLRSRGLTDSTIRRARLGYLPGSKPEHYKYGYRRNWIIDEKPVHIHCGIYIPHFADGHLWAVRVRRPPGLDGPKYIGFRGGSKALYRADAIEPGMPVYLDEGEFNALVVDSCAFDLVCAVSIASASNKTLDSRWLAHLISAPIILTRMDSDQAGSSADSVLSQLSSRIRPVQVPACKDPNDFYLAHGWQSVRQWIEDCLR